MTSWWMMGIILIVCDFVWEWGKVSGSGIIVVGCGVALIVMAIVSLGVNFLCEYQCQYQYENECEDECGCDHGNWSKCGYGCGCGCGCKLQIVKCSNSNKIFNVSRDFQIL